MLPTNGQLALLMLAVVFFCVGGGISLARLWGDRGGLRIAAKACLYSGLCCALGVLIWHSIYRGNWFPLEDNFDALIWLGVLLALFVLYVQRKRPLGGLDWFIMPVVILLLIAAAIFGSTKPQKYVDSTWAVVHRLSTYGGAVAFAIAAASGAMYLLANRRLRHKSAVPGPSMGSLERLERLTLESVTLGFALLTIGVLTGVIRLLHTGGHTDLGAQLADEPQGDPLVRGLARLRGGAPLPDQPQLPRAQDRHVEHHRIRPDGGDGRRGAVHARRDPLMQRLMVLGLNHATAPLPVREKLAFNAQQRCAALAAFKQRFPDAEAVLVSTCNRVELYTARAVHGHPRVEEMIEFLAAFHSIAPAEFQPHLYDKSNRDVIEHLFCVAASLDSMVIGETQILGQVREAYDAAREQATAGAWLNPLFQRAIAVGKQVLSQTPIGEGRLSIASVAVDYAKRIFEHFQDKVVLSIGAGKMATLVLQSFSGLHPRRLLVCNRDPAKAEVLAARFGGEAVPFEALSEHLVAADIVLSSTGSTQPIITCKQFEALRRQRRYRPIFLIDIALPRDVEAGVGQIENVYLYNIDDLQQVVAQTQSQRREAVEAARKIVLGQVDEFIIWHRTREMGPVIEQLYGRSHKIAQEELTRTLGKFPNISDEERAHMEDLARRIVNKLLHDPVQTLRNADDAQSPTNQYLHAVMKLFRL